MISTMDMLEVALGNASFIEFDEGVPSALIGIYSKEEWTDFYSMCIADNMEIYIESFSNGVLEYKNLYLSDADNYEEEHCDPLPMRYDFVPFALKMKGLPRKEWLDIAEFEMYKAMRATPLCNYLMTDYEMALDYLYLGWFAPERQFSNSKGHWHAFYDVVDKIKLQKEYFPGIFATIYIQLEGFRQYVVSPDMLETWGVGEEKIYNDILVHASKLLKPDAEIRKEVLDMDGNNIRYWMVFREKREVPTLIAGIDRWLPESIGRMGTLAVIPEEHQGFALKLNNPEDVFMCIATLAPYLEKNYRKNEQDQHRVFMNDLYWTKDGEFYKLDIKKDEDAENAFGYVMQVSGEIAMKMGLGDVIKDNEENEASFDLN